MRTVEAIPRYRAFADLIIDLSTMNNQFRLSRQTLAVMAIFRNEGHVLAEWCHHYISQGADRIFLINHLSTDHYKEVLQPFQRQGIVEVVDAFGDHPQVPAYNSLRPRIRKACRWLLICDLDEFVYGRKGMTIKSYLHSLPWGVSEVLIPWKNFGSSHHIDHPTGLIADNFVYRRSYDTGNGFEANRASVDSSDNWCKYIVRTNRIRHLAVHYASVWYGRLIDANGQSVRGFDGTLPLSEQALESSSLHLNHYPIQSLEYFKAVKMRRPDVNCSQRDNSKTLDYFQRADSNDIFDPELSVTWRSYPHSPSIPTASTRHTFPRQP